MPTTRLFSESPIDAPRPIRVVVIGAGFSGIIAAIRFLQYVKNVHLTVYEACAGVGGTWFSNRYPGLACDIPAHCYQLTFHEKTDWSGFYATGPEIRAYIESIVDKYNLRPFIKLEHRLTSAIYAEDTGKWNLTVQRPSQLGDGVEQFDDSADVLFTGMGGLSRWKWPDIEGFETFSGKIMHSARWETGEGERDGPWEETVKSWATKKVGVIGVGSSAVQIVPALQPKVDRLVNYVRGQTWICAPFFGEHAGKLGLSQGSGNYIFTDKEKEEFKDPTFYKEFRRNLESALNSIHVVTLKDHPASAAGKAAFKAEMLQRLAKSPTIAEHLIPDFPPGCRRLTPGPGYLEAVCEENVSFNTSPIKRILPNGIETVDGNFEELDVIVCATGFDTSFQLGFPVVGRGGLQLSEKYKPHPKLYLSVAVDGFPNWFQSLGPNSAVGSGSLLILIERQVQYAVEATLKLQREHLKSIEVKPEAVEDWDVYLEHHFTKVRVPQFKFSESYTFFRLCLVKSVARGTSKAKRKGRVVALWPGSCLHAVRALEHPRWEDYTYEQLDGHRNRFFWAGNGTTVAEETPDADKAWYLGEGEVDYPPVPLH
ncbi:hypothetical protein C8F01DRAFT_1244412 [Mycena amicta]|nr:hypothetical protein C8F01DRAFT_1244412 [Mycena amicta]